ncbi:MAG: hypothetical protein ACTSVV_03585 [Promethearchaeota archaeon]
MSKKEDLAYIEVRINTTEESEHISITYSLGMKDFLTNAIAEIDPQYFCGYFKNSDNNNVFMTKKYNIIYHTHYSIEEYNGKYISVKSLVFQKSKVHQGNSIMGWDIINVLKYFSNIINSF